LLQDVMPLQAAPGLQNTLPPLLELDPLLVDGASPVVDADDPVFGHPGSEESPIPSVAAPPHATREIKRREPKKARMRDLVRKRKEDEEEKKRSSRRGSRRGP
jgi:hypothetical protein